MHIFCVFLVSGLSAVCMPYLCQQGDIYLLIATMPPASQRVMKMPEDAK